MSGTEIILTYRGDATGARHANLLSTLAWLSQVAPVGVVVVEQDSAPRLTGALPHPLARVLFAYNPGPFNKAWGLNVGARVSRAGILMFSDADLIIPGSMGSWVAPFTRGAFQMVKPYRWLIDLTPEETQAVRAGEFGLRPKRPGGSLPDRQGIAEVIVLCGGSLLIRRHAFLGLGGWDERFRGWGGEDDALTYRLQRARLATIELDEGPALHLWHPRSPETTLRQPHYSDNCALLARYRRHSDSSLERMAELQRQTMGHREKYRPFEQHILPPRTPAPEASDRDKP